MRTFLLNGAAASALLSILVAAAPAQAADLPEAPVFTAPAVAYSWSGFYIGGHVGYAKSNVRDEDDVITIGGTTFVTDGDEDDDEGKFIGGGQVGVNYQVGSFVFGVEGDFAFAKHENDRGFDIFSVGDPGTDVGDGVVSVETEWLATIRGRAGLAFDRFMVYGTGGVAFTKMDVAFGGAGDTNGILLGGEFAFDGDDDDVMTGWTVGAGVEAFITPNLTAKIEYLYINFEEDDFDLDTATVDFSGSNSLDQHIVRAGLNYKFNW